MSIDYRNCIEPMSPYIPGKPIEDVQKEYGLANVVKLASNENPLGCSPSVIEAVVKTIENGSLYPDGNCTALRALLAERCGISPDMLVFGAGTDEVISMIGKVFVNPGDECITAEITFSQYAASVVSMGGKMVYAPMTDYNFNLDEIRKKINNKTKIIFLANPNNPTGTAFGQKAQEEFLAKVPENILVVIDEAYAEYADGLDYPRTLDNIKKYKNVILLKTFSKIYGLASFRVGYGVADARIISLFEKLRCPFNVSTQGQAAAYAGFSDQSFVIKSKESNDRVKEYLCGELRAMSLEYIPSFANFIMVDVQRDSRVVFADLMKKGYIIRPGSAFGMDNYIRVTIGTLEQMIGFTKELRGIINA